MSEKSNAGRPTLKLTLPFSKKQVVITQPNWGLRKTIKKIEKDNKLDGTESTMAMLAQCTEIDGIKVVHWEEFDELLQKDYLYLVDAYQEWDNSEDVKND